MKMPHRQDEINAFVKEFWPPKKPVDNWRGSAPQGGILRKDEVIIEQARKEKNGKFDRLWRGAISDYNNDHSDADDGFVHKLYSYTQDAEQIRRIHAASGLHRPEKSGRRSDYLQRSIERAQENVDWFYLAGWGRAKVRALLKLR